jgi:hypothetical protein
MFTIAKGKLIGIGQSRIVYEHKHNKNFVIKQLRLIPKLKFKHYEKFMIDKNYMEYLAYKNFIKLGLGRFVARCEYFNGHLLMEKSRPLENKHIMVPSLFSNHHSNWGLLKGDIKCIDYDFLKLNNARFQKHLPKNLISNYCVAYCFSDQIKYLKAVQKKYNIKELPFSYKLIQNKHHLQKLLDRKAKMVF